MGLKNDKALGQHWLKDREILAAIADEAALSSEDTVLEIGPGLGTLTSELLRRAKEVVAVEFDDKLAEKLPGQFPGKNLEVVNADILQFDLSRLPAGYKVVASVPYYITSKIIEKLMTAKNKPATAVLLVQKEVAERIAAPVGDMSMLAVSVQTYAKTRLGAVVSRDYFTPPPKVDSQVIVIDTYRMPRVLPENERVFFRVVKAGFSSRRKKLRSSLAAGLAISKPAAEELLHQADVDSEKRAQDVAIEEWIRIARLSA